MLAGFSAVARPPSTVRADLTTAYSTIPANFIGHSVEVSDFVAGYFTPLNTSLINLMKLTGSNGVLRIGGNASDTVTPPNVNSTNAAALASFVAALGAGWTVIWGLDLVANDATTAAAHASTLSAALGPTAIFQFGNEPIDKGALTVAQYQTRWNTYYAAVTAAVPGIKLAAWDDFDFIQTQTAIAGLTPGRAGMSLITQHFYGWTAGGNITAGQLLGSIRGQNYSLSGGASLFRNNAWAGSIPQRLTETNSHTGGGQAGLSDTLVASTWSLNEAITFASHGWQGVDTHSIMNGTDPVPAHYNSLLMAGNTTTWTAGPIFYGQFLFSKLSGQQMVNTQIQGGAINALATIGSGGNANILLVNNNVLGSESIMVDQSSAWSTATVLQVQGSQGILDPNPTVAGAVIGPGGSWSGSTYSINSGQAIILGPGESALVSIQP